MDKNILNKWIFGAALLLFAACTQDDELTDGKVQDLPEGKYPLEIASVSLMAESSAEPWGANAPQTRVSENTTDGNSSKWTNGDGITVQIDGDNTSTGTYKVQVDASGNVTGLTAETALYWKNTTAQKVKGWYPTDITNDIDLKNQSTNLAYALYAETAGTVDYQMTSIELPFTHQLAKIRVVLDGLGKENVTDVKVYTYPACQFTPNDATPKIKGIGTLAYIPMKKTTYDNGVTYCWEANIVPGYEINKVKVNDVECALTTSVTPVAACINTIKLTVNSAPLRPVGGVFTIKAGDDVTIKNYTGTEPIVVNGDAKITLDNVKLTTNGTTVTINNGATATLNVKGTSNSLVSQNGSGIALNNDASIHIEGEGASLSKLEVKASETDENGFNVGIGAKQGDVSINEIKIDKVTLNVFGGKQNSNSGYGSAAIGLNSLSPGAVGYVQKCNSISITYSNITAESDGGACIGLGVIMAGDRGGGNAEIGTITVANSTIQGKSTGNKFGDPGGACVGSGAIVNNFATGKIGKIDITNTTFSNCSVGGYIVGCGGVASTGSANYYSMTDGIIVNGNNKGTVGWNP